MVSLIKRQLASAFCKAALNSMTVFSASLQYLQHLSLYAAGPFDCISTAGCQVGTSYMLLSS